MSTSIISSHKNLWHFCFMPVKACTCMSLCFFQVPQPVGGYRFPRHTDWHSIATCGLNRYHIFRNTMGWKGRVSTCLNQLVGANEITLECYMGAVLQKSAHVRRFEGCSLWPSYTLLGTLKHNVKKVKIFQTLKAGWPVSYSYSQNCNNEDQLVVVDMILF